MDNPFKTLGIEPTATDEEIKQAYRTLSKTFHPDLHADKSEAEQLMYQQMMSKIVEAYEILSDPVKKKQYETTGEVKQDRAKDFEARFAAFMGNIIQLLTESREPLEQYNLILEFEKQIARVEQQLNKDEQEGRRLLERYKVLERRVKYKTRSDMTNFIKDMINKIEIKLEVLPNERDYIAFVKEAIKDYDYTRDGVIITDIYLDQGPV